jgi:hypothetical protein
MAGIGLWDVNFALVFVGILVGRAQLSATEGPDSVTGGTSLKEWLSFQEEAIREFNADNGVTLTAAEGGTGEVGSIGSEGPTTIVINPGNTAVNAAFLSWFQSLSSQLTGEIPELPKETEALLAGIHSSSPDVVVETLMKMANLSTLDLSPEQQKLMKEKLTTLADTIALANKGGGAYSLNMTATFLILPVLIETLDLNTDTSLSADDRQKIMAALTSISQSIAAANFQTLVYAPAPSPEYLALTSADPEQVGALLLTMTGGMTRPEGISSEDLSGALSYMTTVLCSSSPEDQAMLRSVDRDGLTALFERALNNAVAAGVISQDVATKLLNTVVPQLVDNIISINQSKLAGDLRSSTSSVRENALVTLTLGTGGPPLNPPSRGIVMSYLQVLLQALIYISNLRSMMLQMEGTFADSLSRAKLSVVAAEVRVANSMYMNEIAKTTKTYEKRIDDIRQQELMRWLMPFIAVIVAIIAVVLAVLGVIFTGGTGTVAAILGAVSLISGLIGLVSSTIVLVITLTDAICQWATGKGMWELLANAMGITNPLEVAAFNMAFQIIIQAIAIIATLGVYSVAAGLKIATVVAENAARIAMATTQILISTIFSSGIVTQLFLELGKVLFKDEKDAGIFSIVMTMVILLITIISMFIAGKVISMKDHAKALQLGKEAAKEAAEHVDEATLAAKQAEQMVQNTKELLKPLEDQAKELSGSLRAAQDVVKAGASVDAAGAARNAANATYEAALRSFRAAASLGVQAKEGAQIALQEAGDALAQADEVLAAARQALGQAENIAHTTLAEAPALINRLTAQLAPIAEQIRGLNSKLAGYLDDLYQAKRALGEAEEELAKATKNLEQIQGVKGQAPKPTAAPVGAGGAAGGAAGGGAAGGAVAGAATPSGVVNNAVEVAKETAGNAVTHFLKNLKEAARHYLMEQSRTATAAAITKEAAETSVEALSSSTGALHSAGLAVKNLLSHFKAYFDFRPEMMMMGTGPGALAKAVSVTVLKVVYDGLSVAAFAAKIAMYALQIQAAQKKIYYAEVLAEMAQQSADLRAIIETISGLAGLDQSATLQMLTETSRESFDNWTSLLQMVSDFIKDAGERVTALSNKGTL